MSAMEVSLIPFWINSENAESTIAFFFFFLLSSTFPITNPPASEQILNYLSSDLISAVWKMNFTLPSIPSAIKSSV